MLTAWVDVGTRRVGATVGYPAAGVEVDRIAVATGVVAGGTAEGSTGLVVSPADDSVGTVVSVAGGTGLVVGVAAAGAPALRSANAIERLPRTSTMDRTA